MASDDLLHIEVACSLTAGEVRRRELRLPEGSTVADAIAASGILAGHPGVSPESWAVGVWGRLKKLDHPLRDQDRVELYRPLQVDPKEARRLRYRNHRGKPAGR